MDLLYYSDLDFKKVSKQFEKVSGQLSRSDFSSADVKKMPAPFITGRVLTGPFGGSMPRWSPGGLQVVSRWSPVGSLLVMALSALLITNFKDHEKENLSGSDSVRRQQAQNKETAACCS